MFDQEFVKQFAGLGSIAAMAKVPGPRTASYCTDNEHAGECTEISTEAIRAHDRADNAHGLRCHGEYRGGMGRLSLVAAAVLVPPTGRESDHDGLHAVVSRPTPWRRPW
jgi:hypothetical protein